VRDGDDYVINGQKVWITNGFNCGVVLVACKTDPAAGAKGVSLIAVEEGTAGFSRSQPMDKIGLKAQDTAELFFDNVRVPASNLLGEEGRGFVYLMQQLAQERLVIAMRSTEHQLEATATRPIARSSAIRSSAFRTASSSWPRPRPTSPCCAPMSTSWPPSMSPRRAASPASRPPWPSWFTEIMNRYLDEFLQLHGGYGYSAEYEIGRAWVDARVSRIAGGASEVLKDIISRNL
jgi:acyl-CoA dehydrogenase